MRVSGVTIPREKRIVIALTYIYGIGSTKAKKILETAKISESVRVKDLTQEEEDKIRTIIEKNETTQHLKQK